MTPVGLKRALVPTHPPKGVFLRVPPRPPPKGEPFGNPEPQGRILMGEIVVVRAHAVRPGMVVPAHRPRSVFLGVPPKHSRQRGEPPRKSLDGLAGVTVAVCRW